MAARPEEVGWIATVIEYVWPSGPRTRNTRQDKARRDKDKKKTKRDEESKENRKVQHGETTSRQTTKVQGPEGMQEAAERGL